jgi:DNA repair exonuclease SbcCD ATPase subunit
MRLEQLTIGGFGRLQGNYDLTAPLTLVIGANEAGKSTFHDAVVRSIYGFAPDERRRHEGITAKDHRKPWTGTSFSLTLRALDHEGRAVVTVWDFEAEFAELHDALTGKVIVREQPKQRADYEIGRLLVGITREEFTQVCCLYQGAVETVRSSEGLHAALQRAVESAPAEDIGVDIADSRLRGLLSDIGVHGGHYGPLANGELDRLSKREKELHEQLEQAQQQRTELDNVSAQLNEARQRRQDCSERTVAIEQGIMRTAVASLKARSERAVDLAAKSQDRPATGPTLTRELVGRQQELQTQLNALSSREAALLAQVEANEEEISEQEGALVAVRQRIDALTVNEGLDLRGEKAVRTALADVRAASAEIPGRPLGEEPQRDPTLARFREIRDEIVAQRAGQTISAWNNGLLAFALALAAVGAGTAALVSPALALLVVIAAVCVWVARPRAVSGTGPASLPVFEGRSLVELDQQCAEEDRTISSFTAVRDAQQQRESGQRDHSLERHRQLVNALPSHETDETPDRTIERAEAYLAECDEFRALTQARAELKQQQGKLDRLNAPARRLAEVKIERASPVAELSELYRQAGLDPQDTGAVSSSFAAQANAAQREEERITLAEQANAALLEVLDGQTAEEIQLELQAAKTALVEHESVHGRRSENDTSAQDDGEHNLARAKKALTEREIEVAELQTIVKEREDGLVEPGDLEVELTQVETRRARLELIRDAIRIARTTLQTAAQDTHRRVAPFLNEALRRELPRITRGRYADGTVDEDLAIRLYTPESGRLVSIEQLSRGTRDQVALVQRLEIARLLDATSGDAPLFLDDPFAHFDAERLRLGAELIAEVSGRRQVILFTEDAAVMERMQEACSECTVIELPDPVKDAPTALALSSPSV